MLRLLALAALLVPVSSLAQGASQRIAAGETVQGELDRADATLSDDSRYDPYVYHGAPGETVVFTLRSSDFDAYLSGGPTEDSFADRDDDDAGGTDARLTVRMTGRPYYVRANARYSQQMGRYSLSVRSLGGSSAPPSVVASGTVLRDGEAANGSLSASDAELPDGSYVDEYTYQGEPGDEVTVTLRSGDFDAHLTVGMMIGGAFSLTDRDDNSGGARDAQLRATAGYDGSFVIQANSTFAGETGDYQLSVARIVDETLTDALPLKNRVSGRLEASDRRLADGSLYDLYVYRGAPGESVVITMRSDDFDAYLGGAAEAEGAINGQDVDDDGAGGADARLRVQTGIDGAYYVRAGSLLGDQTGTYTVSVRAATDGDPPR